VIITKIQWQLAALVIGKNKKLQAFETCSFPFPTIFIVSLKLFGLQTLRSPRAPLLANSVSLSFHPPSAPTMGLSIAQLPQFLPLTPAATTNNENVAIDFKVFASTKPLSSSTAATTAETAFVATCAVSAKQARADSIDYFLAEAMPTGALEMLNTELWICLVGNRGCGKGLGEGSIWLTNGFSHPPIFLGDRARERAQTNLLTLSTPPPPFHLTPHPGIFSSYDDAPDFGPEGVANWVPELPAVTETATATDANAVVPVLSAAAAALPPAATAAAASVLLLPPPVRLSNNNNTVAPELPVAATAAPAPPLPLPAKLSSVGLRRRARTSTEEEGGAPSKNKKSSSSSSPKKTNTNAAPSTPAAEALDAAAATFGRVPKVSVPASAAVAVAQAAAAAAMAGAPPPSLPPPKLGKRKAVDLASIADVQERRRERRLAKNRATAAVSRERKHAQMQALAVTVYELQREGRKLGEKLAEREGEVKALRAKLAELGKVGVEAAASVPTTLDEEEEERMET